MYATAAAKQSPLVKVVNLKDIPGNNTDLAQYLANIGEANVAMYNLRYQVPSLVKYCGLLLDHKLEEETPETLKVLYVEMAEIFVFLREGRYPADF